MRKAATHWWLRNHRDLIPNTFALKTIFGWVTDKELNRYTRDFDREAEAGLAALFASTPALHSISLSIRRTYRRQGASPRTTQVHQFCRSSVASLGKSWFSQPDS